MLTRWRERLEFTAPTARRIVTGLGFALATACWFAALGSMWMLLSPEFERVTPMGPPPPPVMSPVFPIMFMAACVAWVVATLNTTPMTAASATVFTATPALLRIADLAYRWLDEPSNIEEPGLTFLHIAAWWMVVFLSVSVGFLLVERSHRHDRRWDDQFG